MTQTYYQVAMKAWRYEQRKRTPRNLAREFKGGLTMVGLARKYGLTRAEVERRIWRVLKNATR